MRSNRYDVIVVGGGTTGTVAALAAARGRAHTAIIECEGFLGGNAANGLPWLGFHHAETSQRVVGGIPYEIIRSLQETGGATAFASDPICGSAVGVDTVRLKMLLAKLTQAEGISCYLHTFAIKAEPAQEGGWKLRIANAEGQHTLEASVLLDCTDSGMIAVSAGAQYSFGREADHKPQVASNVIRFGNVDIDSMLAYFREHPDQMRPFALSEECLQKHLSTVEKAELFVLGAFPQLIAQAKEEGLQYERDRLIGVADVRRRELMLVCSRVENVNPMDNEGYSRAEFSGLQQTEGIIALLRRYIPGCRSAYPISSGHTLGLRETNHIVGDMRLEAQDLLRARAFCDVIAQGGYHLDVHSPDHSGLNSHFTPVYQIPYRVMLPVGLENMLVAGRCVSASQTAQASIRVIPILGALGQAAGQAAALAIAQKATVRTVDVKKLQDVLKRNGALLP